jgi:DNA repair exonuclease SbcCD nuclease subunit
MKIVICSDFHINKANRLEDTKDAMSQILEYCKTQKDIKALFFLGDAYTSRRPRQNEMRIFERWSQQISELGIKQIYLVGNHDKDEETSALGEFEELKVQNVKIAESGNIVKLGDLKIYLGHELLKEAKLGPLNYSTKKEVLTTEQLLYRHKDVNIFLLGHVHKPQVLNKQPAVVYVGSIERENFGERDEKKYFMTIEVETKKLSFHELKIRPMIQFEVNSLDQVLLKPEIEKLPIVKIVLKGTRDIVNKELSRKEKLTELKKATYDLTIQSVIESVIRKRETSISDIETPVNNLKLYCKEKGIGEKTTLLGLKIIEKVLKK